MLFLHADLLLYSKIYCFQLIFVAVSNLPFNNVGNFTKTTSKERFQLSLGTWKASSAWTCIITTSRGPFRSRWENWNLLCFCEYNWNLAAYLYYTFFYFFIFEVVLAYIFIHALKWIDILSKTFHDCLKNVSNDLLGSLN